MKSMDLRRTARIVALKSLFAADIKGFPDEESMEWLAGEDSLPAKAVDFAQVLIRGVSDNWPTSDNVIERYAPAWPVDQLSLVDRNILRIALYELLFTPQIPRKSAINEAVELAKVFGSESSARFVNGVLGSVMAGLETGEVALDDTALEGR
jgi:N utilization substance protein B